MYVKLKVKNEWKISKNKIIFRKDHNMKEFILAVLWILRNIGYIFCEAESTSIALLLCKTLT